jgi:hypothetical protein
MSLIFLFLIVLAFSDFPRRTHFQPFMLLTFPLTAVGSSRSLPAYRGVAGTWGCDIRDYSLIQALSRIKRASRHVSFIGTWD